MAQQPTLTPGAWVQLNPSTDSPRAALPSIAEQGIGIIRQAFTAAGQKVYLVVWNPGDARPQTGLYKEAELTPLSQQDANNRMNQMASGSTPSLPTQGSQYQQPPVPAQALPQTQEPGLYSL